MNAYQVVFIFLAALMTICNTEDDYYEDSPERRECGQYGFRCMDEKTLEFCPISVDGVTDKSVLYECEDDYFCDEDNPAYCTPKEPPNKLIQEATKSEETHGGGVGIVSYESHPYDGILFDEESYYRQARVPRHSKDDECCVEETTTEVPSTTTEEDESDFTTVDFTPAPPFDCDTYGFFSDKKNNSLFWYCDVPPSGDGFFLRHMMCGRGRHFDELLKNCILEGTIRPQRKDCAAKSNRKNTTKPSESVMNCMEKKPGKYPDEKNCRVYHLCLPKQFSPAIQLSFICPRGTAYDSTCQSCTIAAFNRCQSKQKLPVKGQINCKSPTRFRSIEDCSSYFLCFVDNVIEIKCPKFYKFDDMALECLPEKVAECKEYST